MDSKAIASDKIPRSTSDDYTRDQAELGRRFAEGKAGSSLAHVASYSFDPAILPGNIEDFVSVAQVRSGSPFHCTSTANTPAEPQIAECQASEQACDIGAAGGLLLKPPLHANL